MISPEGFLNKLNQQELTKISNIFVMRHKTIRFNFKEGYHLDVEYELKNGKVMYFVPPNNWFDEDQMVDKITFLCK